MVAFLFGAVWDAIAGYLKAWRGVNEVITTLLLNYIAINIISYLLQYPLKAPDPPRPYSPLIAQSARLPLLLTLSLAPYGIILGFFVAIIASILLL
ncbi:permease protein of sugar ABC transporter [Richelia intracellularis]|nr:permease protein of sugar ABC transporter [Richelia intracellularis]